MCSTALSGQAMFLWLMKTRMSLGICTQVVRQTGSIARLGGIYKYGELENDWWAYTMADNSKRGWMNEVYFKGGNNNEPDAGIINC